MGLLDRFRRRGHGTGSTGAIVRGSDNADQQHLLEFIRSRRGVEGFVEPRTTITDVTLLLVAHDGEWTRRRVPSEKWAHDFANRNGVPSYDAGLVGIPDRMRAWNRAQKERLKQQLDRDLDGGSGS
ncbi:hypothetical protein [Marmoricola sp. URHB0036]|jgi:hypothetical protein|uniref:hypothetical protein n=1 Tax=Marmoricola sp. URHB0036 TaxID=1298863 RepID=UPI000687657E|nr:hypothetical protein [Marmoricola sp. URHB0036]